MTYESRGRGGGEPYLVPVNSSRSAKRSIWVTIRYSRQSSCVH